MLIARARLSRSLYALTLILPVALLAAPTPAEAAPSATLVISEVYGGGGNSGAPLQNDFIELYNRSSAPFDLTGYSVQYRSSTGGLGGVTVLSGSIPAGKHWLVQEGAGAGNGAPLPTADASGAIAMSGTNGIVALAHATTAVPANDPAVIDLVGYGTATAFETAAAPALSNTTSASRNATGTDTDNNSADFTVGAPGPENSSSGEEPPTDPTEATIEEIQGTGTDSPLVGDAVVTTGVVTAAYPTGGFNGFYLQELANEASDPAASDGVFVFSPGEVGEVSIGDYVEVTGPVSEFNGLTEIGPTTDGVSVEPLPADAVLPAAKAVAFPDNDADREALEGMLIAPQGDYTVGEMFDLNSFGEIGLAAGSTPLATPTEVADAQDATAIAAAKADIEARQLSLDDGASLNFLGADANKDIPLPWLTPTNQVRTGASVTFHDDVVLDWRNSVWKLQPTSRVTDDGHAVATFASTREAAPKPVGGDLKIASFNVLNYFTTTGADYVAGGGSCTFFDDRDGNHVTTDDCGATGPRGAADDEDLARQQAKIVAAINGLSADVLSLEEIENSAKFGPDRDAALSTLVDALNAAAGSEMWEFAPTPATAGDQTTEDVIRTAFIYKKAVVELVGPSRILQDPSFDNARDPLAQGFKPLGGADDSVFAAIVNHFKSKGSGFDDGTGQGLSNPSRVAQAQALVAFADSVKSDLGTDKVFLTGDFNSYTKEDPLQVLYAAGYTDIGAALHPDEYTYVFDGLVGSLDHVLANGPALDTVTGAHVWNINSVESVAHEYSRFNYNVTSFYESTPFRASDHDPLLVGLDLPDAPPASPVHASSDEIVFGSKGVVHVTVDGVPTPTGKVRVLDGNKVLGSAKLSGGATDVTIPASSLAVGSHDLTVSYDGSRQADAASTMLTVVVVKATPSMTLQVSPAKIRAGKTSPEVKVTVKAPQQTVSGEVQVWENGTKLGSANLSGGKATVTLAPYATPGGHSLEVRYLGSPTTVAATGTVGFTVVV